MKSDPNAWAEENLDRLKGLNLTPANTEKLIDELYLHQIEREMLKEELRRTQFEIETQEKVYSGLYNSAPVSLLTLDKDDVIIEENYTACKMLCFGHESPRGKAFSEFIACDSQDDYYLHQQKVRVTREIQDCEICMVHIDQSEFHAHICGVLVNGNNTRVCVLKGSQHLHDGHGHKWTNNP
ncbi:MAG: hypothetical protein HQL31_10580 [Planctomycetes bacterium]|nr:hypothetical protein [Planctomycetota bacterium]